MRPRAALAAALALCLCLAAPASARRRGHGRRRRAPDAMELLRRTLKPRAASYEGVLSVELFEHGFVSSRRVAVRFRRPGLYRRELLDASGRPAQVVVSDGKREWIYERASNRVWENAAPDPDVKRLGPDDAFDLIAANYEAVAGATAPVAGRSCWLVELRSRSDGHLQRRLWIDRRTKLVLASEDFRPGGGLAASSRFESLRFPGYQSKKLFRFVVPPGAKIARGLDPDYKSLGEAKAASGMQPKVPSWLPSGYVFESLDVLPRSGHKIIHYRFSDGVNVLSLFQCPPKVRLDFGTLKTAQSVRVGSGDGTLAWTEEGQALGWEQGRLHFLLVGPLSGDTLVRVADSVR
ncbi:MAG: hypothetical protein KGO96_11090 [Elusimicrobia bacterium]|nr:hypothetical protein [Elusimicrobiota bacterium]MDE2236907.1 hypothetical protein [Elusimicrobiota bacterium]MDE2426437.1 hypothetical protein [Elusimicrobiota bacterium]